MRVHALIFSMSTIEKLLLHGVFAVAALFCLTLGVYAQSEQLETIPDRGLHSTSSYALGNIETINTTSGNLMLDIPLTSLPPGRGGHPGFQLRLRYNSKLWDGKGDMAQLPDRPDQKVAVTWLVNSKEGGWRYNIPRNYSWSLDNRNSHGRVYPESDPRHSHIWKLKVSFPDGSVREFRPYGYDDAWDDGYFNVQPAAGMSYFSVDGTYLRLDIGQNGNWTLFFPDGSRVESIGGGGQRTYDRNGNFNELQSVDNYNNTGHKATIVADQLGRSIVIEYGTNEDYIHSKGFNGTSIMTTVKWSSTYVTKTYRAGNHNQYDVNWTDRIVPTVSQIILPSQLGGNLKYTFGYNGSPTSGTGTVSAGWGELNSITLPSGAKADYQYFMDNKSGAGIQADRVLENSPTRKDLNYTLEYDNTSTPAPTEIWRYDIKEDWAQIISPDGGVTTEWFHSVPTKGRVYKTQRPDGTVIERIWKENRPYQPSGVTLPNDIVVNPYVEKEFISIPDAIGTLVKTSIKDYTYDKNGNIKMVKEYDWIAYSSVPRDSNGKPIGLPGGVLPARVSATVYYSATPDASDTTTDDPDSYLKVTAPRLLNAVASTEVGNGSQTLARSEFVYDNATTTGNLTQQKSWDSTKGAYSNPLTTSNSIFVSHQYDVYGNPTLSTDARGHQTKLTYGSVGGYIDLYPTETVSAYGTSVQRTSSQVYDFYTGLVTSATDVDNNVTTETDYDVFGRPIETRAAANIPSLKTVTRIEYSDVNRLVITRSDLNTAYDGKLVSVRHYDQLGRVRLSRQLEDSSLSATDETTGIKVQTRHRIVNPCQPDNTPECVNANRSNMASYQLVSNPYHAAKSSEAGVEATMGWTRSRADNGGRVIEVGTFSGSSLPAPWATNTASTGVVATTYNANFATVADQALKVRRSKTDGLGRLTRVDEPNVNNDLGTVDDPVQPTSYVYDALGNLTQVNQGVQTRTFSYSSLSRLISVTNPEAHNQQGVPIPTTYQYDNNGNLMQKVDARSIVTNYTYDELNRVTSRTYQNDNGVTPAVSYKYDSQSLPASAPAFDRGPSAGRLVAVLYGGATSTTGSYQGYDALGRVKRSIQRTNDGQADQTYTFANYDYDLAGNLMSQTYPSGKVVVAEYDNAGRLAGVKKQGGNYYAGASSDGQDRFRYSAHGAVTEMKLGNNLWEHTTFNSRLQPAQIGLGTAQAGVDRLKLSYTYGSTDNNGNVQSQTITVPSIETLPSLTVTQTYEYDALNRLLWAKEMNGSTQIWKQSYLYDRYGNRRFKESSEDTTLPEINPGNQNATNPAISDLNNQLSSTGYGYDAAGNLQCNPANPCNQTTGAPYYEYDAENQMVKTGGGANIFNTSSANYLYDGDGRRVRKAVGNTTTVFVYNALGQLVAEYGNQGSSGSGISYLTADHLGSTRVVTGSDKQLKSRHDYLPFGEEITAGVGGRTTDQGYSQPSGIRQGYTGYEKDGETGLNFAQNRYYSPTMGRFTSPDEPFADQWEDDPQSWNLYTYVGNNPLLYIDPFGLWKKRVENGVIFYEAEKGDTFTSLAKELGVDAQSLVNFYHQGEDIALGQIFNVSNYLDDREERDSLIVTGHDDIFDSPPVELSGPRPAPKPLSVFKRQLAPNTPLYPTMRLPDLPSLPRINPNIFAKGTLRRKPGSLGKFKGRDALRRENKVVRDVAKKLKLTDDQWDQLHKAVSGEGMGYKEILKIAEEMFPKQ